MKRFLALFAIAVLAAGAANAVLTTTTFTLEAVRTGKRFGPFEARQGARVILGTEMYAVRIGGESLSLAAVGSNTVYGPFDLVEGRLLSIANTMYTLLEVQTLAVSEPAPPAPSLPAAPAPTPRAPAPVPAPAPLAPSSPEPAAVKAEPLRVWTPAPAVEEPALDAPLWSMGVGCNLLDAEAYTWTVRDIKALDTQIDRQDMFVSVALGGLRARAGLLLSAACDDAISSDDLYLRNAGVDNGAGWWLGIDYRGEVWSQGPWALSLAADGIYRSETYTLSYDAWSSGQTVIPGGTNGADVIQTVWTYRAVETDLSFQEAAVRAGGDLGFHGRNWDVYAGARFLFVGNTDFEGHMRAGNREYAFDLDRSGAMVFTAGASYGTRGGLLWTADAELGDDTILRLGVARAF